MASLENLVNMALGVLAPHLLPEAQMAETVAGEVEKIVPDVRARIAKVEDFLTRHFGVMFS